jgi:hypothetical protein
MRYALFMRILPVAATTADIKFSTDKAGAFLESLANVEQLGLPVIVNTFGMNPDGTYRVSVAAMANAAVNYFWAGAAKPEWYPRLGL